MELGKIVLFTSSQQAYLTKTLAKYYFHMKSINRQDQKRKKKKKRARNEKSQESIHSLLHAYTIKENPPPPLPLDLVDDEQHELLLLPSLLPLSSAHCKTLEHDGDAGENVAGFCALAGFAREDLLFLISFFSGPIISGHITPQSPTWKTNTPYPQFPISPPVMLPTQFKTSQKKSTSVPPTVIRSFPLNFHASLFTTRLVSPSTFTFNTPPLHSMEISCLDPKN